MTSLLQDLDWNHSKARKGVELHVIQQQGFESDISAANVQGDHPKDRVKAGG